MYHILLMPVIGKTGHYIIPDKPDMPDHKLDSHHSSLAWKPTQQGE